MHKTKNKNAFMNWASKYQSGQADYEASRPCFTGSVCRERANYIMKILINKYNLTHVCKNFVIYFNPSPCIFSQPE